MANQAPENVSEAAIAPEVSGVSSKSAEAEALLANESDEAVQTEGGEVGLSEEMTEKAEAAEAEVIEKVNSGAGDGATTAAPVDPQMAAAANSKTTAAEKA